MPCFFISRQIQGQLKIAEGKCQAIHEFFFICINTFLDLLLLYSLFSIPLQPVDPCISCQPFLCMVILIQVRVFCYNDNAAITMLTLVQIPMTELDKPMVLCGARI